MATQQVGEVPSLYYMFDVWETLAFWIPAFYAVAQATEHGRKMK